MPVLCALRRKSQRQHLKCHWKEKEEHIKPGSNAVFWLRILVASFCFQEVSWFLGSSATTSFTSLLIRPVCSKLSHGHELTMPGQCSQAGRALQWDIRRPRLWPWLCPSWRGTLDKCLRSWASLSSPRKQRGWDWMVMFPDSFRL